MSKLFKFNIYYILFLLFIIITITILCFRNSDTNTMSKTDSLSECSVNVPLLEYSPLTYSKFIDIRNDNEHFSYLTLDYLDKINNYNKNLAISFGGFSGNFSISEIASYKGSYHILRPSNSTSYTKQYFSPQEVSVIYDYLESNHTYFFNGEEYEGIQEFPYYTAKGIIPHSNYNLYKYNFVLSIFEANSETKVWSIQKCVDEYPGPDHPLYGLFQILEEDFISKFEEE